MNIVFEDKSVKPEIRKKVEKILSHNGHREGSIILMEVIDYEMDWIDTEDRFIAGHKDYCDIYMVYEDLRTWKQPLSLIAVEW